MKKILFVVFIKSWFYADRPLLNNVVNGKITGYDTLGGRLWLPYPAVVRQMQLDERGDAPFPFRIPGCELVEHRGSLQPGKSLSRAEAFLVGGGGAHGS